eukprot:1337297-Amphidinium_carterae.1
MSNAACLGGSTSCGKSAQSAMSLFPKSICRSHGPRIGEINVQLSVAPLVGCMFASALDAWLYNGAGSSWTGLVRCCSQVRDCAPMRQCRNCRAETVVTKNSRCSSLLPCGRAGIVGQMHMHRAKCSFRLSQVIQQQKDRKSKHYFMQSLCKSDSYRMVFLDGCRSEAPTSLFQGHCGEAPGRHRMRSRKLQEDFEEERQHGQLSAMILIS